MLVIALTMRAEEVGRTLGEPLADADDVAEVTNDADGLVNPSFIDPFGCIPDENFFFSLVWCFFS